MKPDIVADFCAQMEARLAPFAEVGSDLRTNIRAVAEAVLGKMDVVSRAELDEQNALLADAAAKLAELEEKITALEREKDATSAAGAKTKAAKKPKTAKKE